MNHGTRPISPPVHGVMSAVRSTASSLDDIYQLERAWPEALVNADIDLLEDIWSDDFSLTTPDGTQLNRDDLLADLCGGQIKFEAFATHANEMLIHGDDVVVNGPAKVRCVRGLQNFDAAAHYVTIYSRRGEAWQQVATIVTGPPRTKLGCVE
jgi:Domain of unknown function (DUF4440)